MNLINKSKIMDSLYNIEQDLLSVINELEENGGEFTPELEEKLVISQENLREKLTSYVAVINRMTAQIDACKCEEKRISTLRKSRENTLERIKNNVLGAVHTFGYVTKNGNYVIDLDTCRLSTRLSSSVNIDEERVEDYVRCFIRFIAQNEADNCSQKEYTDDEMLIYINLVYKAICEEDNKEYVPFTMQDALNIPITVEYNSPNIFELYSFRKLIHSICYRPNFTIKHNCTKTNMKQLDYGKDNDGNPLVTVASITNKDNLQIK